MVEELTAQLLRLATVPPESFLLVHGQALEASERFLGVLGD